VKLIIAMLFVEIRLCTSSVHYHLMQVCFVHLQGKAEDGEQTESNTSSAEFLRHLESGSGSLGAGSSGGGASRSA
jgi:hypothetical protein